MDAGISTSKDAIEAKIKTFKFACGKEGMTMKLTLMLFGALAAALGSSSAQAEELAKPASMSKPILTSTITCNGSAGVPMTADAEQALPLKVIATLECGQEVTN